MLFAKERCRIQCFEMFEQVYLYCITHYRI